MKRYRTREAYDREILALLQSIAPVVSATVLQQLSHVLYGMLVSNNRMTMLEISRWTEAGGSYRTIQRFYHTPLLWWQIQSVVRKAVGISKLKTRC